ncbi:hypothetical protein PRIPAC_89154 [Pristionchus pacificus]|uniref:Uncharacterized protein n=1 Tax=Pristionchus pacificus TaxID=54126 RepID=A0A2A6BZB8_PRIPA|nr:hypothetical protein PRIPAC_89154 [Pristionchus pacificus]|eukprot:PDM71230.1 hypothetical protein PRIPAC_43613 [Pristionchus pacificus]
MLINQSLIIPSQKTNAEQGASKYVIKNARGQPSEAYWLGMMRDWLMIIQNQTDQAIAKGQIDVAKACIHHSNSTKNSVGKVRLVDATGVINPDGFYNYLTAWFNQDNMMHYVTQASFFPNPPSWAVNGICLLLNPWAVVSILAILVWMTTQLVDFHGWAGIKMNPVSAVTTAVGIDCGGGPSSLWRFGFGGVEFTAHVGLAFLTSLGNRQERMAAVVDRIFVLVDNMMQVESILGRKEDNEQ